MQNKIVFTVISLILFFGNALKAQKTSPEQYVEKYKYIAIEKMHEFKIPASITLAQGILESASGNSELAKKANNHFGIKCHSDWEGERYYYDDDEKDECFRVYNNPEESFKDHSLFLQKKRYEKLFTYKTTDYKKWAKGLKKAGYATDPKYPDRLIDIIERYELYKYDKVDEKELKKMMKENNISLEKEKPVAKEEEKIENEKNKISEVVDPETAEIKADTREVKYKNRIKYIVWQEDDDIDEICEEMGMWKWQIYKYNEIGKGKDINPGTIIYLQPKRWKAEDKFHTVKKGETLWSISQKHGIKMKWLLKRNRMEPGDEIEAGDKLWLRKKKPIELIEAENEAEELPGTENGEVKASKP